jgi:hypothetical protein
MTREQFETFIKSRPRNYHSVARWPDEARYAWPGQYIDVAVRLAWEVLQEANRLAKGEEESRG